jgi:hypothetical protein
MPVWQARGVVVRTVALMIVRRVLGVLCCGPTPDADIDVIRTGLVTALSGLFRAPLQDS